VIGYAKKGIPMKRRKLDLRAEAYSDAADCLFAMAADCSSVDRMKEYEFIAKKLDREATKLEATKAT
jgi:hypothetical protein